MKMNSLRKLVKEMAYDIIKENNLDTAIEKFKSLKSSIPKEDSIYVSIGGGSHLPSPKFNVFAYTNKEPNKKYTLIKTDDENEARNISKKISDIIFGKPEESPSVPPQNTKLSRQYTVHDGTFRVGQSDDVKKLFDMTKNSDYPTIEKMTPEDRMKYLSYVDKQPKDFTSKSTGGV